MDTTLKKGGLEELFPVSPLLTDVRAREQTSYIISIPIIERENNWAAHIWSERCSLLLIAVCFLPSFPLAYPELLQPLFLPP